MRDEQGALVTRWDGHTLKPHPVTGEPVPDEAARVPQWRYLKPAPAQWPAADYVLGNPPFIGNKRMRDALGDGYVEALRSAHPTVPEVADLVMYWWDHAATLVRQGATRRLGLITTNSIRQTFNRQVIEHHLKAEPPLFLALAVPDHPWVDESGDAAVRIAMTVACAEYHEGRLWTVTEERATGSGEIEVRIESKAGKLHADLRVGADVAAAKPLQSNRRLCWQGCKLVGAGFQVFPSDKAFHLQADASSLGLLRRYWAGGDLTQRRRERSVIDTFGIAEHELRDRFPAAYQWLHDRVLPERRQNRDQGFRSRWWLFGRPRPDLRAACDGLSRYLVTSEVSKHRFFSWLKWPDDLVDGSIVAVALDDDLHLGVLSSSVHLEWALATGGRMGVGNDPRYQNGPCFDNFPFPGEDVGLSESATHRIRAIANRLDAHRRERQAAFPGLTLTAMYNVLEKLRRGDRLSEPEQTTHEHGLVTVLQSLHDELDRTVLHAYNWSDLAEPLSNYSSAAGQARAAAVDELLARLLSLNQRRIAEEAAGTVRWLRRDFQNPERADLQSEISAEIEEAEAPGPISPTPMAKRVWPVGLPEQIKAVSEVMATAGRPLTLDDLAANFTARGRWRDRLPTIVETLEAIGRARRTGQAETPAWAAA
jgi:hypothetical protein